MFEILARIDIRFRWPIVVLWIVAAVAASRVLPSLGTVTQATNVGFLWATAPSQQAAALAAPFRGPSAGDTALIVTARSPLPTTQQSGGSSRPQRTYLGSSSSATRARRRTARPAARSS